MESQGWELGTNGSCRTVGRIGVAREIEEETVEMPVRAAEDKVHVPVAAEDKVHVAVAAELKAGKATLLWAILNNPRDTTFVLVHVHVPGRMNPIKGGKFHVSSRSGEQVSAYRQLEWDKMEKRLDEYLTLCSQLKVIAEKLVIEKDDVVQGLVELIAEFGITKLVMGTAADKRYSKKMKQLKYKTAISVMEHAGPSCKIWFVCKGNLICTREARAHASRMEQSPTANKSFISGQSKHLSSRFSPSRKNELFNLFQNPSPDHSTRDSFNLAKTPNQDSGLCILGSSTDHWEGISRTSQRSDHLSASANDEEHSNSASISLPNDVDSEYWSAGLCAVQDSEEDLQLSSLHHELQDSDSDDDVSNKLHAALKEAESLKHEAYEESCKRRKAEMQLIFSRQKVKASENLHVKEVRYRKEIEEALDREKFEVEKLKNQQAEVLEQLQKTIEQKVELELKLAESDQTSKHFEEKLSAACSRLHLLEDDHDVLQREQETVVKEAEELRRKLEQTSAGYFWPFNSEFSYVELEQATQNFNNSLKIGGGFGRVYKGLLRNTTVAIKMLHPRSLQGQAEFHQEVAVLGRVRHPNIATLIGACFDAFALIYEFLPNGSLEDCLTHTNSTPTLTWKVRTCIIAEICSALIFLHSNRPHPVVHGDLKPANILLDANFVSKLGDFGICRFLDGSNTSTTLCCNAHSKGTSMYIDPEFFTTGELTPHSDVYSFGIIILRLLTGKPALRIAGEVQEALDNGFLHAIIDPSAGDWPFVQAKQLAHLGVRCSDKSRRNRPDLVVEVWRVVEPMMKAALLSVSPLSCGSFSDENNSIPSYFICPIFQEIMRDPHIAADGFTYEAEAIKGWIDSGHETSPMTNLKLLNHELVPNRALRSAIHEWLQQQQQS